MKTTSFLGLFRNSDTSPAITAVSIPILQRDYAQGRQTGRVPRIRERFLDALCGALIDGPSLTLDFVYGEVRAGRLIPLDGQQRLTTLFLLHVYLSSRAGVPMGIPADAFSYATRAGARWFSRMLVVHLPEWAGSGVAPYVWLRDQPWFRRSWGKDPTIASMGVMLDALHERLAEREPCALWSRLSSGEAVGFYFLALNEMGLTDDLYIKMNTRGRELTAFEHFKARFEKTLDEVSEAHGTDFKVKVDNAWAAMLWPYAGNGWLKGFGATAAGPADYLVDDEFLAYLRFLTEVSGRLCGLRPFGDDLEKPAADVFGAQNPGALAAQKFLIAAFDCWCSGVGPAEFFGAAFALNAHEPGKITLYSPFEGGTIDLFGACLKSYALSAGRRAFSLKNTLLLYAVVVHRVERTDEVQGRLRVVRNLAEHSELELEKLGPLLRLVAEVMRSGVAALAGIEAFSRRQTLEEVKKANLRTQHSDLAAVLDALEDSPLLRGCLAAFDLDDAVALPHRAEAFLRCFADDKCWAPVSGALLAMGDYAIRIREVHWDNRLLVWAPHKRESLDAILTGPGAGKVRPVLGQLLDGEAGEVPVEEWARGRVATFLDERETAGQLDWRYYLLKYPEMQPDGRGDTGVYVGIEGKLGFSLAKLRTPSTSGYYRDPWLLAAVRRTPGAAAASHGPMWPDDSDPWHAGDPGAPRWLTLSESGARLRFAPDGVVLGPPTDPAYQTAYEAVLRASGAEPIASDEGLVRVAQVLIQGVAYDTEDRVLIASSLLGKLLHLTQPSPALAV